VTQQDVLHVDATSPEATIVGDLSDASVLPSATFDCILLTQTLHLIFDLQRAAQQLHRALKPGGVLLLTVPGITPVDRGEWGGRWCWSFTSVSAEQLFASVFGAEQVTVDVQGNVLAATAFLQGLAAEEMQADQLREFDPAYPVLVTVVAQRTTGG
jgi:SAM-dependent methyltransferase